MPVNVLKIVPAGAELGPGDTQAFEAIGEDGKPAARVTWSVAEEKIGHFAAGAGGVYSAPSRFYRSRRLAIVARVMVPDPGKSGQEIEDARGSATIDLDPARSWVPILGAGWVLLFAALLSLLLANWSQLCPQCSPPGLAVSPPVVTLAGGQAQQFVASAPATWTNTVNAAGLYIAPSKIDTEQIVTITATSVSDPRLSGMAIVRLSPAGGLSVVPAKVTIKQGKKVDLTTSATGLGSVAPVWLRPVAGEITPTGSYTAPDDAKPQSIIVLAQAQTPAPAGGTGSTLIAGALVSVIPEDPDACEVPGSGLWRVVLLVAWVGALGGLTHAMGSFGTYVGNRELRTSWLWWYGLKPALSAAVAVLVYLVFRGGFGAPDIGLAAGDCLRVAGFAGLVGLFAEPATVKLKDIFDAIFTPRRDPREDKAGQTKTAAAPTLPQITSLDPNEVKQNEATPVTITGTGFMPGCVVQIANRSFAPTSVSATRLQITISAGVLAAGTHPVVVANKPPGGEVSAPAQIVVAP